MFSIRSDCFNPCFPGSSAERQLHRFWNPQTKVSILVFLDQALKVTSLPSPNSLVNCFNPCFPGSSAERVSTSRRVLIVHVFQSLFSWIKRWKWLLPSALHHRILVSILVFLDQALKVSDKAGEQWSHPKFQSLFSWIKRWKLTACRPNPSGLACFNPCFPGSSAESSYELNPRIDHLTFQSLFSWIKRWKHAGSPTTINERQFQSLFSWIKRWKRIQAPPWSSL